MVHLTENDNSSTDKIKGYFTSFPGFHNDIKHKSAIIHSFCKHFVILRNRQIYQVYIYIKYIQNGTFNLSFLPGYNSTILKYISKKTEEV